MTLAGFMICSLGLSTLAGVFGAMLGVGGGIIIVPALTLLLGIDIRYAIGASIVSVIATSSGAGAAFVREHWTNIRVAMFLEVATTAGALGGAFLAGLLGGRWLHVLFALILGVAAAAMWRRGEPHRSAAKPDRLADRLRLHAIAGGAGSAHAGYTVSRSGLGFVISLGAGLVSGLLGIGGGAIKVPTLNMAMGVPIKAAAATSNFMIGVTAAASAGVYFARGDIDPFIVAPVTIGVLIGAAIGAWAMHRVPARHVRLAFTVTLVAVAIQMARKGLMG